MKKVILLLAVVFSLLKVEGQVNLVEGSLNISVPIYEFKDNVSTLAVKTNLQYQSGKGLEVDELSSSVGSKWNYTGIPVITRNVRGLPDDQREKVGNVFDTTKYPPGYLYNSNSIDLGCPTALTKYPIFKQPNTIVEDDNRTIADRELDEFNYSLGDISGSFVIDKDFNVILLDDNQVKIELIIEDQSLLKGIRTTIKEFIVTDENGLKYYFNEYEIKKLYKIYGTPQPTASPSLFNLSYPIPLAQHPFIINAWYASKIVDIKTGREVKFTYEDNLYKFQALENLHVIVTTGTSNVNGPIFYPPIVLGSGTTTTAPNGSIIDLSGFLGKLGGNLVTNEVIKKDISKIELPNNFSINFNYLSGRKDLPSAKTLETISIKDDLNAELSKIKLVHSYFVKNEIKIPQNSEEEKWSRLCLKEIKIYGKNEELMGNPWSFDYYLGSNATEDFVPPYFFHATDPWGFYNGSNCGVSTSSFLPMAAGGVAGIANTFSWQKVALYNQPHGYGGGVDIFSNCKSGYAKNGIMRKIQNSYGGTEEYEYEQNYQKYNSLEQMNSYDVKPNGDLSVGGVHVSKVIKRESVTAPSMVTEYDYNDDEGHSTLWGYEGLNYTRNSMTLWEAEDKDFDPSKLECFYHYLYAPRAKSETASALEKALNVYTKIRQAKNTLKDIKRIKMRQNRIRSTKPGSTSRKIAVSKRNQELKEIGVKVMINYIVNLLVSCLSDAPFNMNKDKVFFKDHRNTNALPTLFKRVTVKSYSSNGASQGKAVNIFTSKDDYPLLEPSYNAGFNSKERGYYWMYGLPKSVANFNQNWELVTSSEHEYSLKKVDITDLKTKSCNCEPFYTKSKRSDEWNTTATFNEYATSNMPGFNTLPSKMTVEFYNIKKGFYDLKKSTEKIYKSPTNYVTTVTDYTYNPIHNNLATTTGYNSKETKIESKTYYLEDYNLSNPSNTILNQMKNDNIVSVPISTETWQTKPGQEPELLSATVTEFGKILNDAYKPIKTYSLETDRPIPQSQIGVFNPNQLIRDARIKPQVEFFYSEAGNLVATNDVSGSRTNSTIYHHGFQLPIASISNAKFSDCAYSSFENGVAFNNTNTPCWWLWSQWELSGPNPQHVIDPSTPTGKTCYELTGGNIVSLRECYLTTFTRNIDYKLSFWATTNDVNINVPTSNKITGPTISGWTYHEYTINNLGYNLPVLSGNGRIDELRMYPKNASMATVSYEPSIGKITECDANNRIVRYEYDGLGRMTKVLDENRNIIKTYQYNYKN